MSTSPRPWKGLAAMLLLGGLLAVLVVFSPKDSTQDSKPPAIDSSVKNAERTPENTAATEPIRRFAEWTDRFLKTPPHLRTDLLAEGETIARQRKEAFKELIESDPKAALALAIPWSVRKDLPPSIASQIEQPTAFRGDLDVVLALPDRDQPPDPLFKTVRREVINADGRILRAFTFGRMERVPTSRGIPLAGVALDDVIALSDTPVRRFERGEPLPALAKAPGEAICGISGSPTVAASETTIQIGDQLLQHCLPEHADVSISHFVENIAAWGVVSPNGGFNLTPPYNTTGTNRALYVRLAFPDLPGEPISFDAASNTMVLHSQWIVANSYGAVGRVNSDITPVLMLPQTTATYNAGGKDSAVQNDANAALDAAGYNRGSYQFILYRFDGINVNYAGQAVVGGNWTRLRQNGQFLVDHEVGHNYGLHHANGWFASAGTIYGNGVKVEYGNLYDVMGGGDSANQAQYNLYNKAYLGWMPTNRLLNVTTSGVYRIYAHDGHPTLGAGILYGLNLRKDSERYYTVEHRQRAENQSVYAKQVNHGIQVLFSDTHQSEGSQIADMEPGSGHFGDAVVILGRTYSDYAAGIHITPVFRYEDTNAPGNWIDVRVNLGDFPSNRPPTVALTTSTTTPSGAGVPVSFSITASDPDGDELSYFWDFGDFSAPTNSPVVTRSWSSPGVYTVRCIVSDMKGGSSLVQREIRVGNSFRQTVTGRILANGVPVAGATVRATIPTTTVNPARTDENGQFILALGVNGQYGLEATWSQFDTRSNAMVVYTAPATNFTATSLTTGPIDLQGSFTTLANLPPLISLSVGEATLFLAGSNTTLNANSLDPDGFVDRIEFRLDETNLVGTVTDPVRRNYYQYTNFTFATALTNPGVHRLTAVAFDDLRVAATSAPVNIVVVSAAPANDAIAAATPLGGPAGSTSGFNLMATREAGEPSHNGQSSGASVWFRYDGTRSGPMEWSLAGSIRNAALALYSGATPSGLTPVAAGAVPGKLFADVSAGSTYWLAVQSATNDAGGFTLGWRYNAPPQLSVAANPPAGSEFTSTVNSVTIVASAQDPDVDGSIQRLDLLRGGNLILRLTNAPFAFTNSFANLPLGRSDFSVAATDNAGTTISQALSYFVGPGNDQLANARPLILGTMIGTTVGATLEANEPLIRANIPGIGHSVWFKWIAPTRGTLSLTVARAASVVNFGIFTNASPASGVAGLVNLFGSWANDSLSTSVATVADTAYYLKVDGSLGLDLDGFTVTTSFVAPPINDDFNNAIPLLLPSGVSSISGDISQASKEAGEPNPIVSSPGSRSVWYRWTAPVSGSVTGAMTMPGANGILGVYTSSGDPANPTLASLSKVYGSFSGGTVSAKFTASAGTTYFFVVDNYSSSSSATAFTMNFTLPAASLIPPSLVLRRIGNTNIVTLNGSPARAYILQSAPTPTGTWVNVPSILTGTNGLGSWTNVDDTAPRFFRTKDAP